MGTQYDDLVEELLEAEYKVIDILPRRVPADSGGIYFTAERYWMEPSRLKALYEHFAALLLRLNCYYDFAVCTNSEWMERPTPEALVSSVVACADSGWINILLPKPQSLITLYREDLYMTLYHPTPELEDIAAHLAAAEGLFLR